jgi:hypothetical protein
MTQGPTDLERSTLELVRRIASEFETALSRQGLIAGPPEITHSDSPEERETEVVLYVYKDSDVADVLEFGLTKGDEPSLFLKGLEPWLREAFNNIVKRAEDIDSA